MRLMEREQAHENKYAHDEELMFKVRARRNKMAGIWAAQKMGIEPEKYAIELVGALLDKEQLLQRLQKDFAKHKINVSEAEIIAKLNEYIVQSRKEILGE